MLLPEPAIKSRGQAVKQCRVKEVEELTFPVDPKKRSSRLPFSEYTALKEPGRCPPMMSTTRNIVVRGRVRWGEPFPNRFSQLAP